jgi:D-cysteine desulfhydrase
MAPARGGAGATERGADFAARPRRVMLAPMKALTTADLDAIPRLGWVEEATAVTQLPALSAELGLDFLGVKRDDRLGALYGGSKPRKLDYLLAAPPFSSAPVWAAVGGIGSGQLVALTAAAEKLGRRLEAYVFWTTLSAGVLDNLAFTASGPTQVFFHPSRIALGLRRPWLFGVGPTGGRAVVPPGATSALGMIGLVRAGLELGAQIRAGELPAPDRIYVALGSGGTAAGLSVGLALAGVRTEVAAVAVVERIFATRTRLRALQRQVIAALGRAGIDAGEPVPLSIERAHLGPGYAEPTAESLAAGEAALREGLEIEPVYTGKTLAALRAAGGPRVRNVLFWSTVRRGPIPHAADWRSRIPPALDRAVAEPVPDGGSAGSADSAGSAPKLPDTFGRRLGRRRVLVAAGAAITGGLALRITGSPPLPGWRGEVLAAWEARVVAAAAEALLVPGASAAEVAEIPARVDRCLAGMPAAVQREVHAMLALVDHATPLGHHVARFTSLDPEARAAYLSALDARGGTLSQVYRGLRDLCMLALYQQPSTWAALGYDGPRQPLGYDPRGPDRWQWPAYDALVAAPGAS